MSQTTEILERFYKATQTQSHSGLADYLKINRQAVYSAIRNDKIPKEWFFKIAEKTDYSLDWLFDGRGPMKREQTCYLEQENSCEEMDTDNNHSENVPFEDNWMIKATGDPVEDYLATIAFLEKIVLKQSEKISTPHVDRIKQFALSFTGTAA